MEQPNYIRMSPQFFALLKKLTMVSKSKATVLFKGNGRCRITVPTTATFLHISAGPADLDFDCNEVCIASLMEFIRFCELVGFPGKEGSAVSVLDETLTNGHVYPMVRFMDGPEGSAVRTARAICADPTRFDAKARHVPCDRDKDVMNCLATVALDRNELKVLCDELKMVPGCQFVSVVLTRSKVRIYMKGRTGQQITNDIPRNCTRMGSAEHIDAAYAGSHDKFRKVPALYFTILKGIDTDYEVEIRHFKNDKRDKITLKAFSNIVGADPGDPISLYVAGMESDGGEINHEALVE
jgi:hypothetical protein